MEFNLHKYCIENKYDFHKVHIWLMLDYNLSTYFEPFECRRLEKSKIILSIEKGLASSFNLSRFKKAKIKEGKKFNVQQIKQKAVYIRKCEEKYKKGIILNSENEVLSKELEANISRLKEFVLTNQLSQELRRHTQNELNLLSLKLENINKEKNSLDALRKHIENTRNEIIHLHKYISYLDNYIKYESLSDASSKLSRSSNNIIIQNNQLQQKENSLIENFNQHFNWSQINFGDGQIWFLKDGRPIASYPYLRSKRSFNKLKDLYTKRNYPPLKVSFSNGKITKIENLQLLEYLFLFLDNNAGDFSIVDVSSDKLSKYRIYTKNFYKINFRKMLSTDYFTYLIDNCSEKYPIIPLPEKVKTRSGLESIDDSFIFPIEKKENIIWVWESVEESKATYCFVTSKVDFENELQPIFNFLTGEYENKRQMLTRKASINGINPKLKLTHRNFSQWRAELNQFILSKKNSNLFD